MTDIPNRRSLGRRLAGLAPITLAVQALSFASSVAVATVFGANYVTDAYYLALSVPMFTSGVLMVALRLGTIPALTELRDKPSELAARTGELAAGVLVASLVLAALTTSALLALLPAMLGTGDARTLELARQLVLELALLGPLSALAGLLGAVLTVRARAGVPIAVMGFEPVVKTAIVVVTGPALGGHGLAAGNIVGGSLALLTMWLICRRTGLRFGLRRPTDRFVRRILQFSFPLMIAQTILQVNPIVDRAMAGVLGHGSITVLEMALRLFSLPLSLFAGTLIAPIAADWAERLETGGWDALRASVSRAIGVTLTFVPAVVAVGVALHGPLVTALYQGGEFSADAAAETADAFALFLLGLPAYVMVVVLSTLFVLRKNSTFPMLVALANVTLNITFNLLFRPWLGAPGLALSTSVTMTLLCVAYFVAARRAFGPLELRRLAGTGRRGLLAAGVAGCLALLVVTVMPPAADRLSALLVLVPGGAAGLAGAAAVLVPYLRGSRDEAA